MPLDTDTTTIDGAIADLEADLEAIADEVAQIPPSERTGENDTYVNLVKDRPDLERHLGGLEWAREEFGGDAEFTVTGLTTAETSEYRDRLADFRSTTIRQTDASEGAATIYWVAQGCTAGPWYPDDLKTADDSYAERVAAIRAFPQQLTDYLESRVNTLSTVGEREGNFFAEMVDSKTAEYHETSD